MRKLLSCIIISAVVAISQAAALAGLTATIVDPTGAHSIAVMAGSSFTVKVSLTDSPNALVSGQFKVQDVSSSGFFTINSATFNGTASPPSGWYEELNPAPQSLASANAYTSDEFGATAYDLVNGVSTPDDMLTLNISLSASAPVGGTYDLNLVDLVFGNTNFDEESATAGMAFQVTTIPAPSAAWLGVIGLAVVAWTRRRLATNDRIVASAVPERA